jgi:hypothetical protein
MKAVRTERHRGTLIPRSRLLTAASTTTKRMKTARTKRFLNVSRMVSVATTGISPATAGTVTADTHTADTHTADTHTADTHAADTGPDGSSPLPVPHASDHAPHPCHDRP